MKPVAFFLGIQIGLTGYSAPYLLRICSVSSPYKGTFIGRRYGLDTARTRPGYGAGLPSERHEFSFRKASFMIKNAEDWLSAVVDISFGRCFFPIMPMSICSLVLLSEMSAAKRRKRLAVISR